MQCAHLQICFNCWWSRNFSATCVVDGQFTHRPSQFHPLSSMKWNLTSVVASTVVKIGIVQLIYISVCWRFRHHNFKQYVDICDIRFLDAEDVTRFTCVNWSKTIQLHINWSQTTLLQVVVLQGYHAITFPVETLFFLRRYAWAEVEIIIRVCVGRFAKLRLFVEIIIRVCVGRFAKLRLFFSALIFTCNGFCPEPNSTDSEWETLRTRRRRWHSQNTSRYIQVLKKGLSMQDECVCEFEQIWKPKCLDSIWS